MTNRDPHAPETPEAEPKTVEVIVNGQPVQIAAGPIREIVAEAIRVAGQIGAPIDQWVLRTREGDIIPHTLPGGLEYALTGGQRVFMHLGLPRETPEAEPTTVGELLNTIDGAVWAKEFCRITGFADESWALAWFCNAIMAGFDEANRRRDDAAASAGERERLREHSEHYRRALRRIVDNDHTCSCDDHSGNDCCASIEDFNCGFCIASRALLAVPAAATGCICADDGDGMAIYSQECPNELHAHRAKVGWKRGLKSPGGGPTPAQEDQ